MRWKYSHDCKKLNQKSTCWLRPGYSQFSYILFFIFWLFSLSYHLSIIFLLGILYYENIRNYSYLYFFLQFISLIIVHVKYRLLLGNVFFWKDFPLFVNILVILQWHAAKLNLFFKLEYCISTFFSGLIQNLKTNFCFQINEEAWLSALKRLLGHTLGSSLCFRFIARWQWWSQ